MPSVAQVAVACTDGGVQKLLKAFNVETILLRRILKMNSSYASSKVELQNCSLLSFDVSFGGVEFLVFLTKTRLFHLT